MHALLWLSCVPYGYCKCGRRHMSNCVAVNWRLKRRRRPKELGRIRVERETLVQDSARFHSSLRDVAAARPPSSFSPPLQGRACRLGCSSAGVTSLLLQEPFPFQLNKRSSWFHRWFLRSAHHRSYPGALDLCSDSARDFFFPLNW